MTKVFDNYSQYYNLLYQDKNYALEADYIASLLGNNVKTVLELGCGTGKHAKLLEEKGYEIFGVDLSDTMLEQAKTLGIDCTKGDARTFRANTKFDAVISLFHVASYQTTDEDVLNFFETANVHLEKGGEFIFDLWYKPAVLAQVPEKRVKTLENDEIKVTRYCTPEHIEERNIVNVNYDIEIKNKRTSQKETITETHVMRYFSDEDIKRFANLKGFDIIKSEEWLTKNNPNENTWGVCFIAVKN